MKSFFLAIASIAAVVVVLGTMEINLLRVHATSEASSRVAVSIPVAPPTVNVKVDGIVTIWSDAPGFTSPKVQSLHTFAKLVQDPARGIWTITMTNLSIAWNASTVLTLQNGKVASGFLRSSTNAAYLIVPLKGVPLINTIQFNLSTDGSVTTTNRQIIRGSRVDQKGRITLIGSKTHIGLFNNQAQISIQSALSPWPLLRSNPPVRKTI